MGPMHLGHEVHATQPLPVGTQHQWVLSASEIRQNPLCNGNDG